MAATRLKKVGKRANKGGKASVTTRNMYGYKSSESGYYVKGQCKFKFVKTLNIQPSTVHYIIKRVRESGEISVCKGHEQRLNIDACEP